MNTCQEPSRWLSFAGAAVLATALSGPANAAIVNGGFENGDLSGWTTFGDQSFVGVDAGFSNSGTFAAFFGPETLAGIEQTLSLKPNSSYTVSFQLSLQDSATPNAFAWSWNGVEQGSLDDASAFGYTEFLAQVATDSSGAGRLAFEFSNPNSYWLLDDVSVTLISEPWPLALLTLGVAALVLARMRAAAR